MITSEPHNDTYYSNNTNYLRITHPTQNEIYHIIVQVYNKDIITPKKYYIKILRENSELL